MTYRAWIGSALLLTVPVVAGAAGFELPAATAHPQAVGPEVESPTATASTAQDEGEATEEPSPSPPVTDIFLIEFDTTSIPWQVGKVGRVTDREAYDNQPYFESDGESILFTSARGEQTDIVRYSITSGATKRLTETTESEYSATPIPGWPGFSTVRVEADGAQRLWRFCSSGGCSPELLFEGIQPVGYHAWIGSETVAMFVLGEPHELVIGELATEEAKTVATDIGRALHRVPGTYAVSYVDKSNGEPWTITLFDLATSRKTKVLQTPPASEDFIWWSDRELLIGHGSKLYLFDLDSSDDWQEVADLSEHGIAGITRLSTAPGGNRLAVVSEREQ